MIADAHPISASRARSAVIRPLNRTNVHPRSRRKCLKLDSTTDVGICSRSESAVTGACSVDDIATRPAKESARADRSRASPRGPPVVSAYTVGAHTSYGDERPYGDGRPHPAANPGLCISVEHVLVSQACGDQLCYGVPRFTTLTPASFSR